MTAVMEALSDVSHRIADLTGRRPTPSELELLATGRAHVFVKDGQELLLPSHRGGSVGSGAVYARNLPAPNTYRIDPVRFAILTSRNEKTYAAMSWPGFSSKVSQRIDKVGVVSKMWILFDGTMTPGASSPTTRQPYPWNLISRLKVSANGISNLFYCDGLDLRALERVRKGFFFDREQTMTLPTGGGAAVDLELIWEVPLAFDESLVGAVFAQTEDNELSVEIETPASNDVFATNAPTMAGSFTVIVEFFSLPYEDSKEGRTLILPDIRQLHGVVAKDDAVTGVGEHTVNLMRTGGILTRILQRFDNAYPGGAGSDDLGNIISSHKFRYGSNVVPRDLPGAVLRRRNQADYGDRILPASDFNSGDVDYFVDDFVKANSVRDVIHLLGVTEPQILNQIVSGTTVNSGAVMHTVQEHMVAG